VKLSLAIYFGSFVLALLWFLWFAAVATNIIDISGNVHLWPLVVAVLAMIGAKFAIRSLEKKAEQNG
jgi:ABC-type transport system involved in cytochrome bd biosynthesis fused ATPase/permease subunit